MSVAPYFTKGSREMSKIKSKNNTENSVVVNKTPLKLRIYKYRWFYLMFIPVFIFLLVFNYLPMTGIRYAFYSYRNAFNIKWVGLANFERLFETSAFWTSFVNTLVISVTKLVLNTGMAVVISLLLNEMVNLVFKKFTQTII